MARGLKWKNCQRFSFRLTTYVALQFTFPTLRGRTQVSVPIPTPNQHPTMELTKARFRISLPSPNWAYYEINLIGALTLFSYSPLPLSLSLTFGYYPSLSTSPFSVTETQPFPLTTAHTCYRARQPVPNRFISIRQGVSMKSEQLDPHMWFWLQAMI